MKLPNILSWFLNDYLLVSYQKSDFIIQQKAKVLSVIALATTIVCLFLYPFLFYLNYPIDVILVAFTPFFICLFVLTLIKKGVFSFAGHLMAVFIFLSVWTVLFIESGNIIMKLDTISYIAGIFTLLSLIEYRSTKIILVYFIVNVSLLAAFYNHIMVDFSVDPDVALEYLVDNLIVLFFVTVICHQVVSINKNALEKANESTKIAQAETEKNHKLAVSLEMKVAQRTKELVDNNLNLQKEITERKATEVKLREAQNQLVETAHKAGMAEIASDSLHNVGNILNSVKTSAFVIKESLSNSPMNNYSLTCDLIREHQDNLLDFLTNNPKGEKAVKYYLKIEKGFQETFDDIATHIDRLNFKIETINHVIVAQQSHAGTVFFTEQLDIIEMVENSLQILKEQEITQDITIIKNFGDDIPAILVQKSKLLHIMINLFKNAFQSMHPDTIQKKELTIDVFVLDNHVNIKVSDTGQGIAEENLEKIFAHGFTTKPEGSGFGLHSCANYAKEMGATITAESRGENKGASFHMTFPIQKEA